MKKNITSIVLIFALLAGFASCKKLDDAYVEENTTADALAVDGSGEEATASAELEEFLKTFNIDTTDPDEVQQQFEQMLDEEAVKVEFEFGEDVIDDSDSTKVEVALGNDGKPDRSNISNNYEKIISGDSFTMDAVLMQKSTDGEEIAVPIYATRDGNKLYAEFSCPYEDKGSITLGMLSLDDGKIYCILPSMRAYILMNQDEMGDIPLGDYISEELTNVESSAVYVETREVVYNNATYSCDIYQDGDVTTKYYYSETDLKRIETVDGDGNITIMEINVMSAEANSSKLKKPSGYFDMTSLLTSGEALAGITL